MQRIAHQRYPGQVRCFDVYSDHSFCSFPVNPKLIIAECYNPEQPNCPTNDTTLKYIKSDINDLKAKSKSNDIT